jgi:uncharacterized protein YdiU (UPF0061 family)
LARFAETLLPLLNQDQKKAVATASEVLTEYPKVFERYWLAGMRTKLGLRTAEAGDLELVQSLLDWMEKSRADFTNTFRNLSSEELPAVEPYLDSDFRAWHSRWQLRVDRDGRPNTSARAAMQTVNPAVIPRNHRVEEALLAAEDRDDLSVLHRLLVVLESPYEVGAGLAHYQDPSSSNDCNYRTFCGT